MEKIVWESEPDNNNRNTNLIDENYDINLNLYLKSLRKMVITYKN